MCPYHVGKARVAGSWGLWAQQPSRGLLHRSSHSPAVPGVLLSAHGCLVPPPALLMIPVHRQHLLHSCIPTQTCTHELKEVEQDKLRLDYKTSSRCFSLSIQPTLISLVACAHLKLERVDLWTGFAVSYSMAWSWSVQVVLDRSETRTRWPRVYCKSHEF